MKKVIIKILIFLILVFLIILALIIFNFKKENKIEQNIKDEYFFSDEEKEILNNYFYDITYENKFFELEDFIDSYYEECNLNNAGTVFEYLDENYINEKNINKDNIFEKINYEKIYNNFFAKKIYYQYDTSNEDELWSIYYVKGILWSNNYNNKKEIFIIIIENLEEEKLYIFPQENINLNENNYEKIIYEKQKEFLNNYNEEDINLLDDEDEQEIEDNLENEVFLEEELDVDEETNTDEEIAGEPEADEEYDILEDNYYNVTAEDIARRLYNEYKIMIIYETEESYNLLTEEIKNNKFNNLNQYKKYIEKNKEKILNGKIQKYKQKYNIINEEKYDTIYSVIDSNNFYFDFFIDYNKNIKFNFKEI